MFGGAFGAFRSKNRHFFIKDSYIYKELSKIIAIRTERIALRRGRQFLREISGDGVGFGLPRFIGESKSIRSIIAWSRIMDIEEIVLAMNNDIRSDRFAWITIDNGLNRENDSYKIIYSTNNMFLDKTAKVENRNGKAFFAEIPKGGFLIYKKVT